MKKLFQIVPMAASQSGILTNKRIIITGGTGFIGSHLLIRILKQNPRKILLLSHGSSTSRISKYLSQIDFRIYKSSSEYVKQIVDFDGDYLYLLGGNADPRVSLVNPREDLEHNLLYNFDLLEKLKRNKNTKIKIIFISSVAVYGEREEALLTENSATIPKSPYGINKLAMEGYIRFFSETFGIKGISVRLFSTYGPGLYKQVVYDFVKALLENPTSLSILGDGSEVRDLTYIEDQIKGLLFLSKKAGYKGEVYNLGSGVGTSVSDLAGEIIKIMKINSKITYKKKKQEKHHGKIWIADIDKVKNLGHTPKITMQDGLKKTIEWIKNV